MIEFRGIRKSFGPKVVLDGVDLVIPKGEVFFLIGASGAGKSVLIKHLIGLLRPDAGEIFLEGRDVSRLDTAALYEVRRLCAMVFQHSTLFDSMTCAENVALPLRKHKAMKDKDALAEALVRLDQVHMREFATRHPSELGDGMRKRVAIARALVMEPQLMLYDEPTSELDPVMSATICEIIATLREEYRVTSIVVSHDRDLALGIADRVGILMGGQLASLGAPAELRNPKDPRIADFLNPKIDLKNPRFKQLET